MSEVTLGTPEPTLAAILQQRAIRRHETQTPAEGTPAITVVELLKGARELISEGWCQNHGAVDADNLPSMCGAPEARAHCLLGALNGARLRLAGYDYTNWQGIEAEAEAKRRLHTQLAHHYHPHYGKRLTLTRWNDQKGRTQAEVLALLEETIACLK